MWLCAFWIATPPGSCDSRNHESWFVQCRGPPWWTKDWKWSKRQGHSVKVESVVWEHWQLHWWGGGGDFNNTIWDHCSKHGFFTTWFDQTHDVNCSTLKQQILWGRALCMFDKNMRMFKFLTWISCERSFAIDLRHWLYGVEYDDIEVVSDAQLKMWFLVSRFEPDRAFVCMDMTDSKHVTYTEFYITLTNQWIAMKWYLGGASSRSGMMYFSTFLFFWNWELVAGPDCPVPWIHGYHTVLYICVWCW